MNRIAICIPTYRRPLLLQKLLLSISECNIDQSLIKELIIVIVDNDINKSAKIPIDKLSKKWVKKSSLHYFHCPIKGLANVRNHLLEKALLNYPDYIIFVDDDEHVDPDWLNKLVETINYYEADAVVGPVISICSPTVSKYAECWFQRPHYSNGTQIHFLVTNNVILRCSSLVKYGVKFDTRFNFSGSEDTYFGIQILKKGAQIFWANGAIVYEVIPENRATLTWLLKRKYRIKGTFSYFLVLEKRYFVMLKTFFLSILYILLGLFSSVALLSRLKRKYWGPLKVAEGLGGLGGLFKITYQEYKKIPTRIYLDLLYLIGY